MTWGNKFVYVTGDGGLMWEQTSWDHMASRNLIFLTMNHGWLCIWYVQHTGIGSSLQCDETLTVRCLQLCKRSIADLHYRIVFIFYLQTRIYIHEVDKMWGNVRPSVHLRELIRCWQLSCQVDLLLKLLNDAVMSWRRDVILNFF